MHFFGTVTSRVGQDVTPIGLRARRGLLGALLLASAPVAHAFHLLGSCSAAADDAQPIRLAQAATPTTDAVVAPLRLSQGVRASLGLKFDPVLNLEPSSSTDTPVYIFGREIFGQMEDDLESRGDAEFRKIGMFIKADVIRQDLVQNELFAEGSVKLFRGGEYFEGPRLRLKLGTMQGSFENISYQLVATGGRGTAERAEFIQPLETRLSKVVYTTCPRDRPAWELRMREMLIDQASEIGSAKSAVFYWGQVPLLPMGNTSFGIGQGRKTGFLPFSYTTSTKLGLEVKTPFYWNIAPQHDLTLYPRFIGTRGVQLGNEFRFLRPNSLGTAIYEVLPGDSKTNTTRQFGSVIASYRPAPNTAIGINIQRASDNNYFSDLGTSLLTSSTRLLPGAVTANTTVSKWNLRAEVQEFQLLQDIGSPILRPYSVLPKLSVSRSHRSIPGRDALPLDWNVLGEMASFQHPTLAQGERFVGVGALAFRHFQDGVNITPKLTVHATHYGQTRAGDSAMTAERYLNAGLGIFTNNVGSTSPSSYTRVLPSFSTDLSTTLERPLKLGASGLEQTLEPRVSYVYTPYQDQSKLPVFDTGLPSLSFAQLFSDQAFAGHDRVADLNQISAGVTSRLIEEQSGAERLRLAIGQRFYFSDQRVVLPGGNARSDRRSDLFGAASARPRRDLTVDSGFRYTPVTSEWQSASLVTRFSPRPASSLSAAYRFVRGSSNTVDLAFQWPVSAGWYAVGRIQQALTNVSGTPGTGASGRVETVGGLEYDGGCWVARIVAQQFPISATERNTVFFFQIEFNGLGRLGNDPLAVLKRNIPNYRSINEITPLPSKFDNFQ
ncbi:MAG: LPS-assembly protein LptD [Betaproteobacteria bacterium]|nr:LPS-assembly protein LptD [Betaproteobacteria bacterium]